MPGPRTHRTKPRKDYGFHHTDWPSRRSIRVGPDAALDTVLVAIEAHFRSAIVYDSRDAELALTLQNARLRIPILLAHAFGPDRRFVQKFVETLKVGPHELRIVADPHSHGVTV